MDIAEPFHPLHIAWVIGVAAWLGFGLASAWFVRVIRRAPADPPLDRGSGRTGVETTARTPGRRD